MKKEIYKFLENYSYAPLSINRLIVSTFVYSQKIDIANNKLLRPYLIKEGEKDFKSLQKFQSICSLNNIEDLIQIFEFIISPVEKVVTGAVYTPNNIRDFIIEECFSKITDFETLKICDPACGCAGFLYTAAQVIKLKTGRSYYDIFSKNIFGLDIQDYSITRSKLLLTLMALAEGEVVTEFKFNLFHGNALDFKWSGEISNYKGFQVIVGNPPYVCSRNMDEVSLKLLDNWSVTKSGHPDLYIPFFQIGYENLAKGGEL
ncbi:MAG: SAM-dependent methyltransferase, partial [Chitinophagaceae bacterium]|nr:SAM-dependent methyltransferase [Chitinophagaceae bacterium]